MSTIKRINPNTNSSSRKYTSSDNIKNNDVGDVAVVSNLEHIINQAAAAKATSISASKIAKQAQVALGSN